MLHLDYENLSVDIRGNNCSFLWHPQTTHKYILWTECRIFLMLNLLVKVKSKVHPRTGLEGPEEE
jgi:hypothetical protein